MSRSAAVDVGTNTVRLLVSDVDGGALRRVERRLEVPRLGADVDSSRVLRSQAIARTVEVVSVFVQRARELEASRIRVAGTSAVRDAVNREELSSAVREAVGLELEVLDGAEEGRLAYLGATLGLDGGPFCVVDIGGGSTEFVRGGSEAEAVISTDIGSVRLRERCLSSDPPTPGEIGGARALVDIALVDAERHLALVGDETFVGVAGTITTLAALELDLTTYDPDRVHRSRLSAEAVRTWTRRLCGMKVSDIRDLRCMHPGRADVITAGSLILDRICSRWNVGELLVSESDILDGLVADAAGLGTSRDVDAFG